MMNDTDILLLDLEAAEQEARYILTKEGIDPDKIGRHFFTGWPETKIYFADIGNINPKLSKFSETAHYAYRMLGACMLIREALTECKDDEERRRMTYILNLGQFREISAIGLNVPRARKFLKSESGSKGGKSKKGKYGPVKKLIETVIKDLQAKGKTVNHRNIKDRLKDNAYCRKLVEFEDINYDIEEQKLSFGILTKKGERRYVIEFSTLDKNISKLKSK